jgi:hypothetical protein
MPLLLNLLLQRNVGGQALPVCLSIKSATSANLQLQFRGKQRRESSK